MDVKYDKKAKQIVVTIPYDEAADYPLNEKTNKTRTVASSGGFTPVQGAPDGLKISVHVFNKKDVPKA